MDYSLVSVLISISFSPSPLLMQFWSERITQKDIVTTVWGNFVCSMEPKQDKVLLFGMLLPHLLSLYCSPEVGSLPQLN